MNEEILAPSLRSKTLGDIQNAYNKMLCGKVAREKWYADQCRSDLCTVYDAVKQGACDESWYLTYICELLTGYIMSEIRQTGQLKNTAGDAQYDVDDLVSASHMAVIAKFRKKGYNPYQTTPASYFKNEMREQRRLVTRKQTMNIYEQTNARILNKAAKAAGLDPSDPAVTNGQLAVVSGMSLRTVCRVREAMLKEVCSYEGVEGTVESSGTSGSFTSPEDALLATERTEVCAAQLSRLTPVELFLVNALFLNPSKRTIRNDEYTQGAGSCETEDDGELQMTVAAVTTKLNTPFGEQFTDELPARVTKMWVRKTALHALLKIAKEKEIREYAQLGDGDFLELSQQFEQASVEDIQAALRGGGKKRSPA